RTRCGVCARGLLRGGRRAPRRAAPGRRGRRRGGRWRARSQRARVRRRLRGRGPGRAPGRARAARAPARGPRAAARRRYRGGAARGGMLIERAELAGRAPLSVRIEAGLVAEVGPALVRRRGEERLDAAGAALLPGLHDHHLHLLALPPAAGPVRCGPPPVRPRGELELALRRAQPRGGWIRGVGYHDSVAGALDRRDLDALAPPGAAVRVQHRSGALWVLSSAGVARLGLDRGADAPGVERDAGGHATGRVYRADAWLRERLGAADPP